MRAQSPARCGASPAPDTKRAKAPASAAGGIAQFGTEQPSMPHTSALRLQPVRSSSTRRMRTCTGMVGPPIALDRLAQMRGGGQHGGVLARAIVVQAGRPLAARGSGRGRRRHRTARARRSRAPPASARRLASRPSTTRHVPRRARMRAAGDGDLGRPEAEALDRPALEERQRLQRLDGRARKDRRGRHRRRPPPARRRRGPRPPRRRARSRPGRRGSARSGSDCASHSSRRLRVNAFCGKAGLGWHRGNAEPTAIDVTRRHRARPRRGRDLPRPDRRTSGRGWPPSSIR